MNFRIVILLTVVLFLSASHSSDKPVMYLIGDSTVKNGSGKGQDGLWGWGNFLHEQMDTSKVSIKNYARGGRSSRTFRTEGLWQRVIDQVKLGDFVLIQFGHNDGGAVNDTTRARGSLRGIGDEIEEIDNLLTKKHEVVHTYGWYLRQYIRETKAKRGVPVVCSLVARNVWKDGKVVRSTDSYATWAKQVAKEEGAYFIDLNNLVATKYETLGPDIVKAELFQEDHTHTNAAGAKINARIVAEELKKLKIKSLKSAFKK